MTIITAVAALAALIELAGALGIAGYCAAALLSVLVHRSPRRARLLVIEGSLWGLGLKTAASLLKTLLVHDWDSILAFTAILALRTVLKRLFTWEQRQIGEQQIGAEGPRAATSGRDGGA